MRLFVSIIACLLFYSCTTLKIEKSRRNITELAIDLQIKEKVNPLYLSLIDSVFDAVIEKFNKESHSYKVHRKNPGDTNFVLIDFRKGKFTSEGERIAGYALSAIGLFAVPFYSYYASNKQFLLLFYMFPHDKFGMHTRLSPTLSRKGGEFANIVIDANSLFASKSRRMEKMAAKLEKFLYKMLLNFDAQITSL